MHVRYFDVGLIPFKINALTQRVNPLKLMEYLAMGIPVVSSPLPEVVKYEDHVAIGAGIMDFSKAIQKAMAEDNPAARKAGQEIAQMHSWHRRSSQLRRLIEKELEQRIGLF